MTARFPAQGIGWKALGTAILQQGRNEEALVPLQRAAELSPGDAQPLNNLGNTFIKLDRMPEAETCYRRALKIVPDFAESHHNLGNTLVKLGKLPEAEASYRRVLEITPGFAEAHYNLGNTLKKQGKLEAAAACYRQCLEIDPKDSLDARLSLAALGLEPMPLRASQAHLEAFYIKKSGAYDNALNPTSTYYGAKLVAQALKSQSNESGQMDILDAGCGTGHVGLLVRDLANRLDGVDMSPSMLEKAREKKIYDSLYRGDLESFMKDNPEKYDAITCAATLIHFGDLSPVFSAAAACLRNDGLFVFTVFQNDSDQDGKEVVVVQLDGLARSGCFAHGRDYVIRLAETAKFAVEMLNTEIHEYSNGVPIMCLVAVLRRCPRLGSLS